MSDSNRLYATDGEVEAVVRGFEDCTLPPAAFDHGAHLTVALYYLRETGLTVPEATTRMREGLYRYLAHNRVDRGKYNETITVFWVRRVRWVLDRAPGGLTLAEAASEAVTRCGASRLLLRYYSKGLLESAEAREGWAEPDLTPLDF